MIEKKFTQLGYELVGKRSTNSEKAIEVVCDQIGAKLPAAYVKMLRTFETAVRFKNEVVFTPIEPSGWAGDDGKLSVDEFYGPKRGSSGLLENIKTFEGNVPDSVIPIGDSSGGNQICLGIRKPTKGKVYFWDHESEFDEADPLNGLSLIADSFRDFINKLEVEPEGEMLDDDGVVDFWISPELLNGSQEKVPLTPLRLAEACKKETESKLRLYLDPACETTIGDMIQAMKLNKSQKAQQKQVLEAVLNEAWYTMLSALDGYEPIGDVKQIFELRDEDGNVLSGEGELESAASEVFHDDE